MSLEVKSAPVDAAAAAPVDLKERVKSICDSIDNLFILHDKVHELKPGEALNLGGITVDKGVLRSMKTDLKNSVKEIPKIFSAKQKRTKTEKVDDGTPPKVRKNGFDTPAYVSPHVVRFFTQNQASLGLDPKSNRALNSLLQSLTTEGLTTSTILTYLWSIYSKHTQHDKVSGQLQELDAKGKPKTVSYYRADDNMKACFGPTGSNTFAALSAKPVKAGKNGKMIPSFNPDRFSYTVWQSIFSHNKLTDADKPGAFRLSPDQAANLKGLDGWRNLCYAAPESLQERDRLVLQSVQAGNFLGNLTAQEQQQVRDFLKAKQKLTQLEAEKQIVHDVHAHYKAASEAAAPKKVGRGKKAQEAVAQVGVSHSGVGNGSGIPTLAAMTGMSNVYGVPKIK